MTALATMPECHNSQNNQRRHENNRDNGAHTSTYWDGTIGDPFSYDASVAVCERRSRGSKGTQLLI